MAIHDESVANCTTGCAINSGVFIVQNTDEARRLMRWWVAFGNRSCSKRVAFPEQACAEKMRRHWGSEMDVVGYRTLNTPVKVSATPTAALRACMADRRNGVCHPLGVRHFCKHRETSINATSRCVHRIRWQMFSTLPFLQ